MNILNVIKKNMYSTNINIYYVCNSLLFKIKNHYQYCSCNKKLTIKILSIYDDLKYNIKIENKLLCISGKDKKLYTILFEHILNIKKIQYDANSNYLVCKQSYDIVYLFNPASRYHIKLLFLRIFLILKKKLSLNIVRKIFRELF